MMLMRKIIVRLLLPVILTCCMTGCDLQRKDTEHPLFVKARKAEHNEKYDEAVVLYRQFLNVRPDSAVAHKALAGLFDDRLDQPLWAVFHYQRYLECDPRAADAADMKKWLDAAKRKFYLKIRREYNDPEDVEALNMDKLQLAKELNTLKKEHAQVVAYAGNLKKHVAYLNLNQDELKAKSVKLEVERDAALKAERELRGKLALEEAELAKERKTLAEVRELNEKFRRELGDKANEITKPPEKREPDKTEKTAEENGGENVPTPVVETPAEKEKTPLPPVGNTAGAIQNPPVETAEIKPVAAESTVEKNKINEEKRFYTVKKGDTLFRISRELYGSTKYYRVLLRANSNILESEKSLRPGQVLAVPALSESDK